MRAPLWRSLEHFCLVPSSPIFWPTEYLFKWEYYILFEFPLWTTVLKCLQEVNWGNQSTYLIIFLLWEITEIASLPSIWKIVLCNFPTFLIVNTRAIPVVIGSSYVSKIPKVDFWTFFVYRALGWSHRLNILLIVLNCMPCLYIPHKLSVYFLSPSLKFDTFNLLFL